MKRQAAEKRGLWGQVFGVVRIAAQGKKGTAFFDALRAKHIRCFGQQIEKDTVQGVIYAKDCKKMRKLAEQYGMVVTETPCKTLQFFLWRHRLRFGIPIGMILASCFLIYCCNVVMLIEVQGNTTISNEKICAVLEECGVKRGSFMGTVPFRRCEHQLRAAIPELCRVAMRHTGNRLVVEVTETPEEVAPLEKRVPCNIVSAYDAEITGVTVRSGQLLCAVKEPVQKGALLVSGVQLDEEGNIRFRHAMADIEGIYQIEETFSCAYEQTIRTSSGREQTKTSLDFFTLELPLSKSQKPYAYGQTMTDDFWKVIADCHLSGNQSRIYRDDLAIYTRRSKTGLGTADSAIRAKFFDGCRDFRKTGDGYKKRNGTMQHRFLYTQGRNWYF